jgi:Type IV secretion system pilin
MLLLTKKNIVTLLAFVAVLFVAATLFGPTTFAEQSEISKDICKGVVSASGDSCSATESTKTVNDLINDVINLLSWAIGVIAVVMLIFGGFKFVTSAGDSGKVSSARQTIVYAVIGLIIVALAQTIVKFVVGQFA